MAKVVAPKPDENNYSANRGPAGCINVVYLQCCECDKYANNEFTQSLTAASSLVVPDVVASCSASAGCHD